MTTAEPEKARELRKLWLRNLLIWAALLALLFSSLGFAYLPLGKVTTAAGIVIAFIKAALVVVLYMELAKSKALVWLAALSGIVFLATLFSLSLADVLSRAT